MQALYTAPLWPQEMLYKQLDGYWLHFWHALLAQFKGNGEWASPQPKAAEDRYVGLMKKVEKWREIHRRWSFNWNPDQDFARAIDQIIRLFQLET